MKFEQLNKSATPHFNSVNLGTLIFSHEKHHHYFSNLTETHVPSTMKS